MTLPLSAVSRRDTSVMVAACAGVGALGLTLPWDTGPMLLALAVLVVVVGATLLDPAVALVVLLTVCLVREGLHSATDAPLSGGLLATAALGLALAVTRRQLRTPRPGLLEGLMGLYLLVNLLSLAAPHDLPALGPALTPYPVLTFLVTGVALPFGMYVLGRALGSSERLVQVVLWWLVAATAYSGATAWMQFHGPQALVWPRFIVESPGWSSRAVGAFNQPVTNGVLLIVGLLTCLWLGSRRCLSRWQRWLVHVVAAGAVYGIYATHTRAIWLAAVIVLAVAPVLSPAFRRGAILVLGLAGLGIVVRWTDFTSADRAAGGVGSSTEIADRLNMFATGVHAFVEKPILGWGLARFPTVNRLHHEQWSNAVDWKRGFGIASHQTELGVLVELGLVGLAAWLAVLVLLIRRVLRARRGPGRSRDGLGDLALLALISLVVTSLTVDVRFLDFAGALI